MARRLLPTPRFDVPFATPASSPMLDLVFLRTFLAIHRSGSITKAARALHLTQPAVSQHLKALEVQVGAKLFRRNPRGVVPTPAAEELSMRVGQHLDALHAVGEDFVHGQRESRGIVHIGAQSDLLALAIVPALSARLDLAALRLIFHPAEGAMLGAMLREAELDAILTTEPPAQGASCEPIFREDVVLVVGVRRWQQLAPLADRERVQSLVVGPFVAYEHGMSLVRDIFHHAIGIELRAAPSVIVPDQRAVAAVAGASSCAAVVPRYVAEPMLATGELFEITTGGERACGRNVSLVYRPGIKGSPRLRTIRSALHDAFHGHFGVDAREAS